MEIYKEQFSQSFEDTVSFRKFFSCYYFWNFKIFMCQVAARDIKYGFISDLCLLVTKCSSVLYLVV